MDLIAECARESLVVVCEKPAAADWLHAGIGQLRRGAPPTVYVCGCTLTGGERTLSAVADTWDFDATYGWGPLESPPRCYVFNGTQKERAPGEVGDYLRSSARVVAVCDDDYRGARIFHNILQIYAGRDSQTEAFAEVALRSLDPVSVEAGFRAAQTTRDAPFVALLEAARIKDLFGANWEIASDRWLSPALRAAGGTDTHPLSKFELMALFVCAKSGPMNEGEILQKLTKWTGTGQYQRAAIGCPASRDEVVQNLQKRGLVVPLPWSKRRTLSDRGLRVLNAISPQMWDPDLAGRITAWMDAGTASVAPMQAYMRARFGAQARLLAQQG